MWSPKLAALGVTYCALCAMLVSLSTQQNAASFYSMTGTGNNLQAGQEEWGKAGAAFLRVKIPAAYDNTSLSAPFGPSGSNRPAPRTVSLGLTNNPGMPYPSKRLSSRNSTSMLTYYGQLVSHDINKRKNLSPATPQDQIPIGVTPSDPWYTVNGSTRYLNVTRSSSVVVNGVKEQVNAVTAFVDLSVIYSTNFTVLNKTRAYVGGQLQMGGPDRMDLPLLSDLKFTDEEVKEYQSAYKDVFVNLRATGDARGNQNAGSLALRTLYFRNHNRLAQQLAANCSDCSDEALFQAARRKNIAVAQAIAFYEYVPQLGIQLDPYTGYNPDVNPGVDNFFSTVSYRYGHAEVTPTMWRLNNDGSEHPEGHLNLVTSYFNPDLSLSAGIEPLLRGLAVQLQGEVEPFFSDAIQQCLFGPAAVNGTDLVSINLARARDHGIPGYNDVREAIGLARALNWQQVTSNDTLIRVLAQIYPAGPDTCDPYICGLAEDKINDSHFGPLFFQTMKEQYTRIRDGDRLYFENTITTGPNAGPGFSQKEINDLKVYGLRDLILENTANVSLPANVWNAGGYGKPMSAEASISGAEVAATVELVPNGYYLSWRFLKSNKEIEISVRAKGEGWIGFGIPQGYRTFMVDADMVIGAQQDASTGKMVVADYWSFTLGQTPITDAQLGGQNSALDGTYVRDGGWTNMTFRRPVKAQDARFDRDITPNTPQWVIFAWHPVSPKLQQHYATTRGQAQINWKQGVAATNSAVSDTATKARRAHGILMAISFVLLLPLGALLARSIRYVFVTSHTVKGLCFYLHIVCQITAVVLSTTGLSIALSKFGKSYTSVHYNHGSLGIAVMCLLYCQLLLGFIRPPGSRTGDLSWIRRAWDVTHSIFGPLVIMLGVGNVVIGIYLFSTLGYGSFTPWAALCGTAVILVGWLQTILDRSERLHLTKMLAAQETGLQKSQHTHASYDAHPAQSRNGSSV